MFSFFNRSPSTCAEGACATPSTPAAPGEARPRRVVAPAVDIAETPAAVVVTADMPGVEQSGVEVSVERGVLTLRGRTGLVDPAKLRLMHGEWEPCDFERRFTIADHLDRDAIRATMRHGVLRVELPKAAAAQPRRIAVSAG